MNDDLRAMEADALAGVCEALLRLVDARAAQLAKVLKQRDAAIAERDEFKDKHAALVLKVAGQAAEQLVPL